MTKIMDEVKEKVSVVIPAYNDYDLVNCCLSFIFDYVDEVIIVDGSPSGGSIPSIESKIDKAFIGGDRLKFTTGTFVNGKGAWDRKSQVKKGHELASSDWIIDMSADMLIDNIHLIHYFFDKVQELWCLSYNFWLDTKYLRVDNGTPAQMICLGSTRKVIDEEKDFNSKVPKAFLPNVTRYHLGWIRPFPQQVKKHIRHIKEGAWGELGKNVIALGEPAIEAWAVQHILKYKRTPHISSSITLHSGELRSMNYIEDYQSYRDDYEQRTGNDFFVGISNAIPNELIV